MENIINATHTNAFDIGAAPALRFVSVDVDVIVDERGLEKYCFWAINYLVKWVSSRSSLYICSISPVASACKCKGR